VTLSPFNLSFFTTLSVSFVRGTHAPRMAHSASPGGRISFVGASTQGRQPEQEYCVRHAAELLQQIQLHA
jgi:hypothetical protein